MGLIELALGFFTICFLLCLYEILETWGTLPGPFCFPVLGNIPQLLWASPHSHLALHKLAKKYGDIMQVKFGQTRMVVISSAEVAKSICSMESVTGRLVTPAIATRMFGKELGIIFTGGEFWKSTKKFVVRSLREVGFGKTGSMDVVIQEQADELVLRMRQQMNVKGMINMTNLFSIPVINVLWSMMAGETFSQNSQKVQKLLEIQNDILQSSDFAAGLAVVFPFLVKLFPNALGIVDLNTVFHEFLKQVMDSHSDALGTESTCFIDTMLMKIKQSKSIEDSSFTDEHGIVILMDLFSAGSDSTNSTITFCVIYATLFPHFQQQIHDEIDSVMNGGVALSIEILNKLPFTRAFIAEVLRHAVVVQTAPPRISYEDIKYNNYVIKKGVPILVNLYAILHDELTYPNPSEFCPERFLDLDGNFNASMAEQSGNFGYGHRLCIGQRVADAIYSLFFIKICQNFKIKSVPGQPIPAIEPKVGFTLTPKQCYIAFETR